MMLKTFDIFGFFLNKFKSSSKGRLTIFCEQRLFLSEIIILIVKL